MAKGRRGTSAKAVILVGGQGTRLQPLTYYVPKPMVPVLNRPFLEHTIAYLKQFGVNDIILALSYLPEVIQNYFGNGSKFGVRMAYAIEVDPLGTAGAVKNAEQYLDGTFIVLNGDIFTELDIADMLAFHRRKRAKVTISLTRVDNPSAFGVVETDTDSRVRRFIEKPSPGTATTNWINAGIYILEPEVMERVPAHNHYMFEKGLFPLLLELNEPVYGYPFKGYWLDMGTVDKYLRLNCDLLLQATKSPLVQGLGRNEVYFGDSVTIHPSAKVQGPAVIGAGCKVDREARIKGPAVMGAGCHIGEKASIEKTVVWDGVKVGAGARLERCVVSSNVKIGDSEQVIECVITPDHVKSTSG